MREIESTRRFCRLPYGELRKLGLSHRRTLAFQAALQLARRASHRVICPGQSFRSSLEIFRYFKPRVHDLKKECFWNVLLDGKNRIQRVVKISEGSLTSSHVHPREVFRPAIRGAALGVLFVHNHPSGDPAPSQEDIQSTRRLAETGKILGIRVLDHVIIGHYRYFSFTDEGIL
jgi:DNA repair protein RadC